MNFLNIVFSLATITIAFSAFLVSLTALFLSIWQGYETRKNYRLSVTPHISIAGNWTFDDSFKGITIENKGIGPAIITKIELSFDNKVFYNSFSPKEFSRFLQDLHLIVMDTDFSGMCYHNFIHGEMLSPGEKIPYFWLGPDDKEDMNKIKTLESVFSNINITIQYQSIYGKKFTTTN